MSNTLHFNRSALSPTLFSVLPLADQSNLRVAGRRRNFSDGQLIQQRGDESSESGGNGFWLIESGAVRVGQFDLGGAFNMVALLGSGDSFGELAALAGQPRVVDAVAVGPAELLFIPAAALENMLAATPQSARAIIGALALELQEALDLLLVLRRSQGSERVARTLANLARDRTLPAQVQVGQQELADLAGTSRMTVSTVLARFERKGLVRRGYGWIEVHDRAGLVAADRD